MTPESFSYWLQGYFELAGTDQGLTPKQAKIVQEHLKLVFERVVKTQIETVEPQIDKDSYALMEMDVKTESKVKLTEQQKEDLREVVKEVSENIKKDPTKTSPTSTGRFRSGNYRDTTRYC